MKIKTNIGKLLVVLAMICSLVAIATVPAAAACVPGADSISVVPVGSWTGSGTFASPYKDSSLVYQGTISVTGGNLTTPGGAAVTVTWDGDAVATVPASPVVTDQVPADGNPCNQYLQLSVVIPETSAGPHYLTVTDGVTKLGSNLAEPDLYKVWVSVAPKIQTLNPIAGKAGDTISFTGYGFARMSSIDIYVGPWTATTIPQGTLAVVSTQTNEKGTVATSFQVPQGIPAGSVNVIAIDGGNNQATKSFTIYPSLTAIPNAGLGGSIVMLRGQNFPAVDVGFKFAGLSINLESVTSGFGTPVTNAGARIGVTPNGSGQFEVSFKVPTSSTGGSKEIGAYALSGITPVTKLTATTFNVSPLQLSVMPPSGKIDDTVIISGSGFPQNVGWCDNCDTTATIQILFDNVPVTSSMTNKWSATTDGALTATCKVPAAKAGLKAVKVSITSGGQTTTKAGTFTIASPTLNVTPNNGPIGTEVVISGTNWVPMASVRVSIAGVPVAPTPADRDGSFSTRVNIPDTAQAGANVVTATDGLNDAVFTYTVPGPAIVLTPVTGSAGTTVTVNGTGFPYYTAIKVTFRGLDVQTTPIQPVVNAQSTFTCTFLVPPSARGQHIVIATSAMDLTKTAAATFYISEELTVESALASIGTSLVRLWQFDATAGWQVYDPTNNIEEFTLMTKGDAYWVKVTGTPNLTFSTGDIRTLKDGWNPFGWY